MDRQPLSAQQGEIEFRARLVRQQVEGAAEFADEHDAAGIEAILAERMADTEAKLRELQATGVPLSPYFELGAERGQRSLVLENRLDARGAAGDISADMLRSCAHYAERFDLARLPLRLCCDANRLPLRTASLPFVFCYQTLHHFPDPAPIVAELRRVLVPGGWLYFDEEPIRRLLRLRLYRAAPIYSTSAQRASRWRQKLDSFCAARVCNEEAFGIVENDDITLAQWRRALEGFDGEVTLHTVHGIETDLFRPRRRVHRVLAHLFGGVIAGLVRKPGEPEPWVERIEQALVCPACLAQGSEVSLSPEWRCPSCGETYPERDGVRLLLPPEQRRALYPE